MKIFLNSISFKIFVFLIFIIILWWILYLPNISFSIFIYINKNNPEFFLLHLLPFFVSGLIFYMEINLGKKMQHTQQQNIELIDKVKELEKIAVIAEKVDNGVMIFDINGDVEWANDASLRIMGFTPEQLFSSKNKNIRKHSNNPNINEFFEFCIYEKKPINYDFSITTFEGDFRWYQTTLTPLIVNNDVINVIAIDMEITMMKLAEEEIEKQQRELVMQAEMLSLINSQMDVQKAAIEEQNDILKDQRMQLSIQTQQLKIANDELEDKNTKIEQQNENIRASIRYARKIQNAILPLKTDIDRYFDSFVLYKPKDIVSGDFYWFTDLKKFNCPAIFMIMVDCTGHGVPGAFMSMIGSRLLNEIILEQQIHTPSEILENVHTKVQKALQQEQTENDDGMDMAICKIEKDCNLESKYKLSFSGAKMPVYIKKQGFDIITLKGDRKSIGGIFSQYKKVDYTNKDVELQSNDIIYLSSDGFIDQNNSERERYGTSNFLQLLEGISLLTMEEQAQEMEIALKTWQQGEDQRDDITVLGLKLL